MGTAYEPSRRADAERSPQRTPSHKEITEERHLPLSASCLFCDLMIFVMKVGIPNRQASAAFDEHRHGIAAAEAQRGDTTLELEPLQLVDERAENTGA